MTTMDLEDDISDIAVCSYADMLHDDERNHAYYLAIKANVNHLVKSPELNPNGDRFYTCCDIGAGSGLLSMMIAKSFRDLNYEHFHVMAYERFMSVADCAERVIKLNGLSDKITVIPESSEDQTQEPKFDLLVAELLDTELIGEGCLYAYQHALKNLCSDDCIFIPAAAKIYIQPLDSEDLWIRNNLKANQRISDKLSVEVDEQWRTCPGLGELDDMQLSQVSKKYQISQLAPPQVAFSFQFDKLDTLKLDDSTEVMFKLTGNGGSSEHKFLVLAMWWDVVMYDESLYIKYLKSPDHPYSFSTLSCAPSWHRDKLFSGQDRYVERTYGRGVWREHWLQAVYYPSGSPNPAQRAGDRETLVIYAHHDPYSLWFSLDSQELSLNSRTCTCGAHRNLSRTECAFLGSRDLCNLLEATHKLDKENCYKIHLNFPTTNEGYKLVRERGFEKINYWATYVSTLSGDSRAREIDSLQGAVSWSNVLRRLLSADKGAADDQPFTRIEIRCAQVCFANLNRFQMRRGMCEGFDLSPLDDMIQEALEGTGETTNSFHLIEYEFKTPPGTSIQTLLSVNSSTAARSPQPPPPPPPPNGVDVQQVFKHRTSIELDIPKACNRDELRKGWALVVWPDFYLIDDVLLPGGHDPRLGELRSESMQPNCNQIVHFLHDHPALADETCDKIRLTVEMTCDSVHVIRE